jgi:hypothetical protein
MKAYAFVFAKTHDANHWRKFFSLANRESENFYLAVHLRSSFATPTIPPPCPKSSPPPFKSFLALSPPPFFFLFYLTY